MKNKRYKYLPLHSKEYLWDENYKTMYKTELAWKRWFKKHWPSPGKGWEIVVIKRNEKTIRLNWASMPL